MPLSRNIFIFLAGILFVTFLVKVPALVDEFHVSRFIVASFFCLWAVVLILPRLQHLRLKPIDGVLFGLYFINLISVSWADNFGEAIFTSQKYLILAIVHLAFRLILEADKKYRDWLHPILIATALIACIVPTYQLIGLASEQGLGGKALYTIPGHSGHKNLASSYLFLLFALLLYWSKELTKKPWLYLLLAWMVILMLLLRTRAVYLAFAAFAFINIAYFLLADPKLRQLAVKRLLPAIVIVTVSGAALISFTGAGQQYLKYLNPATYTQSASAIERGFVWYKTWDLIKDQPVIGYGSGNWKLFFPSKNIEGGFRLQEKDLIFTRVHNDYLEVWAEVGILGISLFAGMFLLGFWQVWKGFRKAKPTFKTRWVVLGTAVLGYCIISFFDFPKERLEHQIALALLLALIFYSKPREGEKSSITLGGSRSRYMVPGLLFVFLLVNAPIGYFRYIGDAASKKILAYRNSDQQQVIRENAIKGNSIWYNVDPMVIPMSWYTGVANYTAGDYEGARGPFLDAFEINPYNFNVVNNLASTLVQLKEYEKAIPLYLKALQINSKFEEGMFNLSFSYHQIGEHEKALEWVNKTQGNPKKKEVFLQEIRAAIDRE